jgi:hypothetical protein
LYAERDLNEKTAADDGQEQSSKKAVLMDASEVTVVF